MPRSIGKQAKITIVGTLKQRMNAMREISEYMPVIVVIAVVVAAIAIIEIAIRAGILF